MDRRESKLMRIASLMLDDEPLPSTEQLPNNNDVAFALLGGGDSAGARSHTIHPEDVEDEEEEDEEEESQQNASNPLEVFSSHGWIGIQLAKFFAYSPTVGYMQILFLAVFMWITFENLTTGTRSCAVALSVIFGVNLAFIILIMVCRSLWTLALRRLYSENRVIPALNDLLDPDLAIFIWTILMHMFWQGEFVQIFDRSGVKSGYHRILFLPISWPYQYIPDPSANLIRLTIVVLVFWAIRNLVVEVIMFRILLGFLTNFRSSVIRYLKSYALLRHLNAKFLKAVGDSGRNTVNVQRSPSIPFGRPAGGGLARQKTRQFAAQIYARKTAEASTHHVQSAGITRAVQSMGRERWSRRKQQAYESQVTGRMLPSVLQKRNIAASQHSDLANLLSITWIRTNPMVLFVRGGERCELKSRKVTKYAAKDLFKELSRYKDALEQAAHDADQSETLARQAMEALRGDDSPPLIGSSPRLTPSPMRPPAGARSIRIELPRTITGKPMRTTSYKDLGDRIAAELGTRNDDDRFDDTDERVSVSSSSSEEEPAEKVPPLETTTKKAIAALPAGRVRQATAASTEQMVYSDPILDASLPMFTRPRGPRRETLPAQLNNMRPLTAAELAGGYRALESVPSRSSGPTAGGMGEGGDSESDSLEAFAETEAPVMSLGTADGAVPPPQTSEGGSPGLLPPKQTPSKSGSVYLKQLAEQEIAAVRQAQKPIKKEALTRAFLRELLDENETQELMDLVESGGRDVITSQSFVKAVLMVHQIRTQMNAALDAQREIERVFHRVASFCLTFIMILAFLFILGISANTIIVSGAAALSACGVVLSFVYTDFIISIILIVFLNPYSIGDSVEIDGEYMVVKRITTYFTEFESGFGKIYYYSHRTLSEKALVNQSRSRNASFSLIIRVGDQMTVSQYKAFKKVINAYMEARPMEFKGNLFIHWLGFQPFHYIELHLMATHCDNWQSPAVWDSKSYWMAFILRQCQLMGLTYTDKRNRVDIFDTHHPSSSNGGTGGAAEETNNETRLINTSPPKAGGKNVQFQQPTGTVRIDLTTPEGTRAALDSLRASSR